MERAEPIVVVVGIVVLLLQIMAMAGEVVGRG